MAQRYGGKYSPTGRVEDDTKTDRQAPERRMQFAGARVDPAGARANILFIPAVVLVFTSLGQGAVGLATGLIADVAADLLGPDVLFHHSKLNFKWPDATSEVKWHQDIQFYPHTNYNVLGTSAGSAFVNGMPSSRMVPACGS